MILNDDLRIGASVIFSFPHIFVFTRSLLILTAYTLFHTHFSHTHFHSLVQSPLTRSLSAESRCCLNDTRWLRQSLTLVTFPACWQ